VADQAQFDGGGYDSRRKPSTISVCLHCCRKTTLNISGKSESEVFQDWISLASFLNSQPSAAFVSDQTLKNQPFFVPILQHRLEKPPRQRGELAFTIAWVVGLGKFEVRIEGHPRFVLV